MEARAILRYARISPRKVSIVMDLIRNKPLDEALAILQYTLKDAGVLQLSLQLSADLVILDEVIAEILLGGKPAAVPVFNNADTNAVRIYFLAHCFPSLLFLFQNNLYVAECYVCPGPTLKRMMPRAQGRGYRILKRTSHMTVVLKEKE